MADFRYLDPDEEDAILRGWDQRQRQLRQARTAMTPELAKRLADIATNVPEANRGLVQAGAVAGLDDETIRAGAANEPEPRGWLERGIESITSKLSAGGSYAFEWGIKPIIRSAFLAFDTVAQEAIQRPGTAALTSIMDGPGGQTFGDAYRDYGNSEGVVAFNRVRQEGLGVLNQNDDPNTQADESFLGTGFFGGGEVAEESYNQRTLQIDGQRATFGKALPTTRALGALGTAASQSDNDVVRRFGRMVAPGETAYNVVAGVSQFAADVFLDPLAVATGGSTTLARAVGTVNKSDKVFQAIEGGAVGAVKRAREFDASAANDAVKAFRDQAGVIDSGTARTVLMERAEKILRRPDVLEEIANADFLTLWESFSKNGANAVDFDLLKDLAAANDPAYVAERLLEAAGRKDITTAGFFKGPGRMRQRVLDSSLSGLAPERTLAHDDLGSAVESLDSWLKVAKVDRAARAEVVERAVNTTSQNELFEVAQEAVLKLPEFADGVPPTLRKVFMNQVDEAGVLGRIYGIDAQTDEPVSMVRKLHDDGAVTLEPSVQMEGEFLQRGFTLPDITKVRRAAERVTRMEKVYTSLGWELTADAARHVTRDWFKPAAILRPAYIVRIGLEEQARLAMSGYDSLLNHPLRYIMANVAARSTKGADAGAFSRGMRALADSKLARDAVGMQERRLSGRAVAALEDAGLPIPPSVNDLSDEALEALREANIADPVEMVTDLTGESLDALADEHDVISSSIWGRSTDRTGRTSSGAPNFVTVTKEDPQYMQGLTESLHRMSADRAARRLAANGGDIDDLVAWARNDKRGRAWAEKVAGTHDEHASILHSDGALREFANNIIMRRIHTMAGGEWDDAAKMVRRPGDDEVLRALSEGKAPSKDVLGRLIDEGRSPNFVPVDKALVESADEVSMRQQAVDWLFENITSKPTSYLARWPTFRQSMIRNIEEGLVAVDESLRTKVVNEAKKSFDVTREEAQRLDRALRMSKGKTGIIEDVSEFNDLIVGRAGAEVKSLLFDVSRRSNAQIALEPLFPFLDAWKEVTTTWGRLSRENPAGIIRAMQGYQSLEQGGVIYNNDFGEKVFAYPGGGVLAELLTPDTVDGGLEVDAVLEGRVQGANIVAQGVGPGFGPLVQWAVGSMDFMDDEGFRQLRDWLAPFGSDIDDADELTDLGAIPRALAPAWAEKVLNALGSGTVDEVQWNSSVGDAAKALAATGAYDPSKDKERFLSDAKKAARWTLIVRGVVQGFLITGPSASWRVKAEGGLADIPTEWDVENDPDGKWFTVGVLANEYRTMLQELNYDDEMASTMFLQQYGIEPFYVSQAKTKGVRETPVTTDGNYWMRDHADAAAAFPRVAGYFVPPELDVGELDYSVYRASIEKGDRQSLSPEQQVEMANKAKGYAMYNSAKNLLAGVPGRRRQQALQQVRDHIDEKLPGWRAEVLGVDSSADTGDKIDEFIRAVDDPSLADSPLVEPLRTYLEVRRRFFEAAQARGAGITAQQNLDLRQALQAVGANLAVQDKAFASVWPNVFQRELEA